MNGAIDLGFERVFGQFKTEHRHPSGGLSKVIEAGTEALQQPSGLIVHLRHSSSCAVGSTEFQPVLLRNSERSVA